MCVVDPPKFNLQKLSLLEMITTKFSVSKFLLNSLKLVSVKLWGDWYDVIPLISPLGGDNKSTTHYAKRTEISLSCSIKQAMPFIIPGVRRVLRNIRAAIDRLGIPTSPSPPTQSPSQNIELEETSFSAEIIHGDAPANHVSSACEVLSNIPIKSTSSIFRPRCSYWVAFIVKLSSKWRM